jgi:1,2-dihydroxy-3-keto-5-methylthiopentene dioxygenase
MQLSWLDSEGPIADSELAKVGVLHERLPVDDAQAALDGLKRARGYVEQDVIELRPDTPNLQVLRDKFKDEHLHRDDEVRFVLAGEGVFDIRSADDRWMRVKVEAGDLIVVPADLYHRFFLTERNEIRCVRLFKDASGWVPEYRGPGAP